MIKETNEKLFKDKATARSSVAKIKKSSRSHAHKIQAAIAMEQRERVMGKTVEAAIYRKFINSMKKKNQKMNEGKSHGDHEHEMIRRQVSSVMNAAKRIKKKVGKGEGDVKAWVQSKITKATDYIDTAADYMDSKDIKDEFLPEILDKKDVPYVKKLVKKLRDGSKTHAKQADDLEVAVNEGSLHKWFKGSKSKDGKGGWVNVVTGGTCASDEPGEGTPKCVSSAKRASMSKKERLSAARRKKKADPNQQSKRGAAKPTYVSTDKKKAVKEEMSDKNFKKLNKDMHDTANAGGGASQETQNKYALELARRRRINKDDTVSTLTNKELKNEETAIESELSNLNEKCWKGYKKKGMKTMFGKRYPNCVKESDLNLIWEKARKMSEDKTIKRWWDDNSDGIEYEKGEVKEGYGKKKKKKMKEEVDTVSEAKDKKGKGSGSKDACYHKVKSRYSVWPSAYASGALVKCRKVGAANWGNSTKESFSWRDDFEFVKEGAAWTKKSGKSESGGLNEKGRKSYERENPGSDLKRPSKKVGNKRRASFCARMKGMKKKLTSKKTANDPDSRINKSLRAWNC